MNCYLKYNEALEVYEVFDLFNGFIASFKEENHAIVFVKLINREWSVITINAMESGYPKLSDFDVRQIGLVPEGRDDGESIS